MCFYQTSLKKIVHIALIQAFLLIPSFPALSRPAAKEYVDGSLTIQNDKGTKTIKLKHAYAQAWLRDGKPELVEIVFTDEPAPEDYAERKVFLPVMAREGRLNALKIEIDSDKEIGSVQFFSEAYEAQKDISAGPGIAPPAPPPPTSARVGKRKAEIPPPPPPPPSEVGDKDGPGRTSIKVLTEKEVEGKLSLEPMLGYGHKEADQCYWSYDVAFKVAVNSGSDPTLVMLLPEGGGEAGKAYLAFYNGVMSEDAKGVKTYLSSESGRFLEGENTQKRLARLKDLIKPLKSVALYSYIYSSNKTAQLYLLDVEDIVFYRNLFKPGQLAPLPPILLGPQTVVQAPMPRRATKGSTKSRPNAAEPEAMNKLPSIIASARMVLEGNSWRVQWLLLNEPEFAWAHNFYPNLLWHLDTYKTEAEKERIEDLPNGEPLSAGGGEPGKAYLEFCRAEKAGDKRSLVKFLTGAQYEAYSNPALSIRRGAFIWKESNALDYANLAITGGVSEDEKAVLNVQALRQGYRTTGRVLMILEDGRWKVEREKWTTDHTKKIPVGRAR